MVEAVGVEPILPLFTYVHQEAFEVHKHGLSVHFLSRSPALP